MAAAARWSLVGLLTLALSFAQLPAQAWEGRAGERVTVFQPGGLDREIEALIRQTASDHGASWVVMHAATIRLASVRRDVDVVQAAPAGWWYPMSAVAVDETAAAPLLTDRTLGALAAGKVVMGETSAGLRDASPGDVIELAGPRGFMLALEIGAVVEDAQIGGSELLLGADEANLVGLVRPSFMVLWGMDEAEALRTGLESRLAEEPAVRVRVSGDPPNPDGVLSSAAIKARFGEFSYRPSPGDRIDIDPDWESANIVTLTLPHLGSFRCHRLMAPYLAGALSDLADEGLIYMLDPDDFQRNGGCYNPREIRGGDKGGAISRHAWGAAIDLNPSRNPYGGQVAMNRGIVEIFRKWGFAWGGGWTFQDGGHFEWRQLPDFLTGADPDGS